MRSGLEGGGRAGRRRRRAGESLDKYISVVGVVGRNETFIRFSCLVVSVLPKNFLNK
jgi:hypothetical protein